MSTVRDKSAEQEDAMGVKKLLNMKWDHLGLRNYNSAIDVIGKMEKSSRRKLAGTFTENQKEATLIEFNIN